MNLRTIMWSLLTCVSFLVEPVQFGNMNMDAFQMLHQMQSQKQKQTNAAATGDASADSGILSSDQTSNMLANNNGTLTNAGSNAGCAGGNCALSGAAQLTAGDQHQIQKAGNNQSVFAGKNAAPGRNGIPISNNFMNSQNMDIQKQIQKQFQIGGAATGTASGTGNVTSQQNTVGETNANGANVLATNFGGGLGTKIDTSGASSAKLQGQVAKQVTGNNANSRVNVAGSAGNRPGCVTIQGSQNGNENKTIAKQGQSQDQADAASAGTGTAGEGQVSSGQVSNVNTSDKGTIATSSNSGKASGRGGLHLSGASSTTGQKADQKQVSKTASGSNADQQLCS